MDNKEKNKFRTKKVWKEFRKEILIERDYRCEICGMKHKKGMNLHHQDESNYTDLKKNKFSLLCKSCHKEVERILSRRRNVVDMDLYCRKLKSIIKKGRRYESNL